MKETTAKHAKEFDPSSLRVQPGEKVDLARRPTRISSFYDSKKAYNKMLEARVDELSELQRLHYASNQHALLLIFQAMDAAGKDGAIRQVMSGVNPQGIMQPRPWPIRQGRPHAVPTKARRRRMDADPAMSASGATTVATE